MQVTCRPFLKNDRDWLHVILAVVSPFVFFWPFVTNIASSVELALYSALLLFWLVDINYLLHLHAHRPFTNYRVANRIIDISLGLVTGMTSANWRIQHVFGHHRDNDADYTREDLQWTLERYGIGRALLYSFGNAWPTFWNPVVESYRKGILANVKTPIDYREAFFEQVAFILFVAAMLLHDPVLTSTFLIPWYVMVFGMTRYVDYLNHYGCGRGDLEIANNCLNKSFNRRIKNFGYHMAHHLYPTAHWTQLPEIHATVAAQIPADRLKPFSWSCAMFPYHAYRAWKKRM